MNIIVLSPTCWIKDEAALINHLFDKGILRYHLNKEASTEQTLAEILAKVRPENLSKITLHSHFHLVLAYGVGGIHYSKNHRLELKEDYNSKVSLYQSFGIQVSTSSEVNKVFSPASYTLVKATNTHIGSVSGISAESKAILSKWIQLKAGSFEEVMEQLQDFIS